MITRKSVGIYQRSKTENLLSNDENETSFDQTSEKDIFDDDTSKLSFKEKMILFNKNKSTTTTNRNRLTQVLKWFIHEWFLSLIHSQSLRKKFKQQRISPRMNINSLDDRFFKHQCSKKIEPMKHICNTYLDDMWVCFTFDVFCFLLSRSLSTLRVCVCFISMSFFIDETTMISPEEAENIIPVSKR